MLTPDLLRLLRQCINKEFVPGPYSLQEETIGSINYHKLMLEGISLEVTASDRILSTWQEASRYRFEAILLRLLKGVLWHSRYHLMPLEHLEETKVWAISAYCMSSGCLPSRFVWHRPPYGIQMDDGSVFEAPEAVVIPMEATTEWPPTELADLIRGMVHGHLIFTATGNSAAPTQAVKTPHRWDKFNPPAMSFKRPEGGWP